MAHSANTDTDTVAYTPEWSNTERTDVGAALSTKAIGTVGMSVEEIEGEDGPAILLRLHDDILHGKFVIEPDRAEWLGQQLIEATGD